MARLVSFLSLVGRERASMYVRAWCQKCDAREERHCLCVAAETERKRVRVVVCVPQLPLFWIVDL